MDYWADERIGRGVNRRMDGHFYTHEGVREMFGHMASDNLFLYRSLGGGAVASQAPECGRLFLLIETDALKWFYISHRGNDKFEPAMAEPIFELPISHNLTLRNELDRILVTRGFTSIPEMQTPDQLYGYQAVYPHFLLRTGDPLLFGAVFLDFLFDLRHSRVFERCSHAASINTGLLGHPLANAIHGKAEYLWHRELHEEILDRDGGRMAHRLIGAEAEWMDTCMEPGAQFLFRQAGDWFDGLEDEVRQVVFACGKDDPADAWEACFQYRQAVGKHAAHTEKVKDFRDPGRRMRFEKIANWFLARYDLNAAAATHLLHLSGQTQAANEAAGKREGRWAWVRHRLATLIPAGLFAFLLLMLSLASPRFLVFPLSLALLVFFGRRLHMRGQRRMKRFSRERRGGRYDTDDSRFPLPYRPVSFAVTLALLCVFCVIAGASLGLFSGGWSLLRIGIMAVVVWTPPAFLSLAACYAGLSAALRQRAKPVQLPLDGLLIAVRLALPRLLFAITSAWVMMYWEGLWDSSKDVGGMRILCIGGPVLAISYIFTVVKVHRIVHDSARAVWRALLALGVAMTISLYAGIVCMSALVPMGGFEEPVKRSTVWGFMNAIYAGKIGRLEIQIYPGALLYLACMAVFFGLFLELIFGDKEMTESL